jgi:hypothetical protein
MLTNRDKLRRTRDGRYEAGVYITKNKYAQYVARVLLPYSYGDQTIEAKAFAPEPSFELAAAASRSWALAHIPGIYGISADDLVVTLMDGPEFDERPLPRGMG